MDEHAPLKEAFDAVLEATGSALLPGAARKEVQRALIPSKNGTLSAGREEAFETFDRDSFAPWQPTGRAFGDGPSAVGAFRLSVGASDAAGTIELHYFPDEPDKTCDMPRHSLRTEIIRGTVIPLDDYCASKGIERIDFLKIDVEGAEHRVLKGLSKMIDGDGVACVQFEYGPFSLDTRFLLKDYFALLALLMPRPIRYRIVPKSIQRKRAHGRAIEQFLVHELDSSVGRSARGSWPEFRPVLLGFRWRAPCK